MSKKKSAPEFDRDVVYAQGFADGLKAATWDCGDCGNSYESNVDFCPNAVLDQANVDLRHALWKAEQ